MKTDRVTQCALAAGAAALAAMAAVSACAPAAKEAPAPTSTPPANSSAAVPSEKGVGPGGPTAFSPTINPAPVPTN
jgi:hypothetical protein